MSFRLNRYNLIPGALILVLLVGIFAYWRCGAFQSPDSTAAPRTSRQVKPRLFKALSIQKAGTYFRMPHSPELNPRPDRNFILVLWFKLNRLPDEGEPFILLNKVDSHLRSQRGYRLSLVREGDFVRPTVYWRSGLPMGGDYKFARMPLKPHVWTMIGISWSNGQYLGVHCVTKVPGEKPEVNLLGGYSLPASVIPDSGADLLVGSFAGARFKGSIGPLAVMSFKKRGDSLYRIFKELGEDMDNLPDFFSRKDIGLWINDGNTDQSEFHQNVQVVRAQSRKEGAGDDDEEDQAQEESKSKQVPALSSVVVPPVVLTPAVITPTVTIPTVITATAAPAVSPSPRVARTPTATRAASKSVQNKKMVSGKSSSAKKPVQPAKKVKTAKPAGKNKTDPKKKSAGGKV